MNIIKLHEPTIFPDYNKKHELPEDHELTEIKLKSLKYKHFRAMLSIPEAEQMHQLMMLIADLSEDDIGELTPQDAAAISGQIYESLGSYIQLGKKLVKEIS